MRGAIAAPALELKGCTTDQKAVAVVMARLRNVDGVTRVSLGKSLKPDAAAAGTVPTTTGAPAGCGEGRPPAFEMVAFFEDSEVPASVQDVTVQAGAAAPATGETTPPNGATPTPTPQEGGS